MFSCVRILVFSEFWLSLCICVLSTIRTHICPRSQIAAKRKGMSETLQRKQFPSFELFKFAFCRTKNSLLHFRSRTIFSNHIPKESMNIFSLRCVLQNYTLSQSRRPLRFMNFVMYCFYSDCATLPEYFGSSTPKSVKYSEK